jgi:hypothetical protein
MDSPVVFLIICGFFAGLVATSRILGWIINVRLAWRDGASRAWLVPLIAHAGPWVLALLAASTWVIASKGHAPWLAAWLCGLVTGPVFVSLVTVRAARGRARSPVPLTPERLAHKRRAFYLINTSAFAVAGMVGGMWTQWSTPTPSIALIVLFTLGGILAGPPYCWFMWQWYGTALEVAEKRRLRRAAERARDA